MHEKLKLELYKEFVDAWGTNAQCLVAVEELSELIKALTKFVNRDGGTEAIKDELADVKNMVGQLEYIFGNVDDIVEYKLNRTKERLENWKNRVK